jgi:peptide/nickel transport system permease protein
MLEPQNFEPQSFMQESSIEERQLFLTPWQITSRRFFRNKLAVSGVAILLLISAFCYIIPLFFAYSETEIFYLDNETKKELRIGEDSAALSDSVLNSLARPSASHPLGTNRMGQDILARLMYGGRISLMVGFIVVAIELVLGIFLGGVAGYYGGAISAVIMRAADIISSIPFVPLMLIIASLLISLKISPARKIYYTMFVMGALYWTAVARLVRGSVLSLREMEFMQAAEAAGIKTFNKIFRHLIPNTLPVIIVTATLDLGTVIILESTLSFLGVGVGAPYASWGNMVSAVNDAEIMRSFPHAWIAPGVLILLTVLAFNFVGDGLRDATDPRLKR